MQQHPTATATPSARFDDLRPRCERAVRRALWACQRADQEDATQVGLTEVWVRLNDPATAGNTDSWYIWRATAYARDYAQRLVYRWQERCAPIVTAEEDDTPPALVNEPMAGDDLRLIEAQHDLGMLLGRLATPLQRQIAARLAAGETRAAAGAALGISSRNVARECGLIAAQLSA